MRRTGVQLHSAEPTPAPALEVSAAVSDKTAIVHVAGELALGTAPELEKVLHGLERDVPRKRIRLRDARSTFASRTLRAGWSGAGLLDEGRLDGSGEGVEYCPGRRHDLGEQDGGGVVLGIGPPEGAESAAPAVAVAASVREVGDADAVAPTAPVEKGRGGGRGALRVCQRVRRHGVDRCGREQRR